MNLRRTVFTIFSLAAITALPCAAQTMRPGLWQVNNKFTSQNSQLAQQMSALQKQIASMPPEQRKMMEEMMSKQAGINLPTMQDGGMVVKVCVTKEMVAQNQLPVHQSGNCTHQRSPMVGRTMKLSFQCTNPESSGEGTATFMSDTAYAMTMHVTAAMDGKKKETTSMAAKGEWLGADCGSIKPMDMPPAKVK
jgi:hypothetical protein